MAFVPTTQTPFLGASLSSTPAKCTARPHAPARARTRPPVAVASPPSKQVTDELVDTLISKLGNTKRGLLISPSDREIIEDTMSKLNEIGATQNPLRDPRLFGKFNVAYSVTVGKSPAAGGLYRSRIGRLLFFPRGIFQHVFSPDTIVNLVCFRFLWLVKGCVGLRGKVSPVESTKVMPPNSVQIVFEQPRIRLGDLVFQVGPRTKVRLTLTYLDERVRLGVGQRGSRFVFSRGGEADSVMADEWNYLFQAKPVPVAFLPVAMLVLTAVAFFTPPAFRIVALLIILGMFYVLRRGGIDEDAPGAIRE